VVTNLQNFLFLQYWNMVLIKQLLLLLSLQSLAICIPLAFVSLSTLVLPMSRMIQYLSFCNWLLSPVIWLNTYLCCCLCQNFLPLQGWIIFYCMTISFCSSIHLSTNACLGCFLLLAVVNNTAVNTGIHVSLGDPVLNSLVCVCRWNCWVMWLFYFSFFGNYQNIFHKQLDYFTVSLKVLQESNCFSTSPVQVWVIS
jgi:hypothetical protein